MKRYAASGRFPRPVHGYEQSLLASSPHWFEEGGASAQNIHARSNRRRKPPAVAW
jgi:hypothetical protein